MKFNFFELMHLLVIVGKGLYLDIPSNMLDIPSNDGENYEKNSQGYEENIRENMGGQNF